MAVRATHPAQGNVKEYSPNKLRIDGAGFTRRIQLSLPDDLAVEQWQHIGKQIFLVMDASAWWIGDWLLFGKSKYPDRYRRAIEETELDYQTLRNYAWIARRFEPSRRRDGLSFQHHIEVASLPESERDEWLDQAEANKWSRNELRMRLRASRPESRVAIESQVTLQIKASKQRKAKWEDAAGRIGCTLCEWATQVLDEAATSR